jgi:hypothetical protein
MCGPWRGFNALRVSANHVPAALLTPRKTLFDLPRYCQSIPVASYGSGQFLLPPVVPARLSSMARRIAQISILWDLFPKIVIFVRKMMPCHAHLLRSAIWRAFPAISTRVSAPVLEFWTLSCAIYFTRRPLRWRIAFHGGRLFSIAIVHAPTASNALYIGGRSSYGR